MKKFLHLFLFSVLFCLFSACGTKTSGEVFIVYTNDVHSYIDNTVKNKETSEEMPALRFSKIAQMVKDMRAEGKNVILVDAGDEIQGNSYGSYDQGESVIRIMNEAGYDLATVGNHEFDYGIPQLNKINGLAKFPYISCNFYKKNGTKLKQYYAPSKIIKAGNKKIAFIGITTPETITSSTPVYFQNDKKEFIYAIAGTENPEDMYKAVQKEIDAVRKKADYVIALGHVGVGVPEVKNKISSFDVIANTTGLDAFIDGHSHTKMEFNPVTDKGGKAVPLTQTGSYLMACGLMSISEDGTISAKLVSDYKASDDKTAELEENFIALIKEQLGKEIAVLDTELYISNPEKEKQRLIRSREMNSGDFVADAAYWYFNEKKQIACDVAIANGGGVRTAVKKGTVTLNDVKRVQPFGNMICLIKATGQQIKDALEMGVTVTGEYDAQWDCPAENGGFLHVAGMRYTVNSSIPSGVKKDDDGMFKSVEGKYRVEKMELYNISSGEYEPMQMDKVYTVGGINYILRNSGNGCSMFRDCDLVVDYAGQDCDIMVEYIKAFAKGDGFAEINTDNSPLKTYTGYQLDYENPFGAGRITIY